MEIITSGLMIYLIILKAQKNCDCSREIFPRLPLLHIALLSEQLTPQEGTAVELGTAGLSTAAGGRPRRYWWGIVVTLPLILLATGISFLWDTPPPSQLSLWCSRKPGWGSHMTYTCQSRSKLLLERDAPFLLDCLGGRMKAGGCLGHLCHHLGRYLWSSQKKQIWQWEGLGFYWYTLNTWVYSSPRTTLRLFHYMNP